MKNDFERKVELSVSGIKKCAWNQVYDSEEELISDMMKVDTSENLPSYKMVKGYAFIQSFQRQIQNGKTLSEKQMVQLKRLACNIAHNLYCIGTCK